MHTTGSVQLTDDTKELTDGKEVSVQIHAVATGYDVRIVRSHDRVTIFRRYYPTVDLAYLTLVEILSSEDDVTLPTLLDTLRRNKEL